MKTKLTRRDVFAYVENGFSKCPFCKSPDVSGDSVEVDSRNAEQSVSCAKCGAEWTDVYTLSDVIVVSPPTEG